MVGISAVGYATTGGGVLLGKTNKADRVTAIRNTGAGAAMRLNTASSATPPFTTNAQGLVSNLYADRAATADTLSGQTLGKVLTAAAPKTTTYVDTANHTSDAVVYGPVSVAAGTYLVTFDADVTLNTHGTTSVPNPMVCQLQSETPTLRPLAEGAWNITGT